MTQAKRGIVIITDDQDRHAFFANRLIQSGLPVQGLITGAKRRYEALGAEAVVGLSDADRRALRAVKQQRRVAESTYFGGECEQLENLLQSECPNIWRDQVSPTDQDINHPRLTARIHAANPEAVVVMGASIIKAPLLNAPFPFLNMHTGLSPYFRGGRTNMWPILERDFGYFGVTVHQISPGIDDGDIFASRQILAKPKDTYPMINARAIGEGTDAMIKVLRRFLSDNTWRGIPQWTQGKLFYDRHYTPRVAARYLAHVDAFITEHIYRQENGQLDSVRLIDPFE